MNQHAIQLTDVHKSFGENHVLRGVNLSIEEEKVFVLLGASGAGKSVCLKHIIGLIRPDSGSVNVMGNELNDLTDNDLMELRKNVGYLFQSGGLLASLSVFENVALPLREHTTMTPGEIRERVMDRLDIVGLSESANVMPDDLSGGMRKRVSLARVIVQEPRIILYDEPTHGLDPIMANRIEELILDLNERFQTTSVVVTHDLSGAFHVADRMGMIHEGKIIKTGSPESFLESEDPRVEEFVREEKPDPDSSSISST